METNKFEQFNVEIVDPTITIDPTQIKVDVVNNTISLSLTLETANAKLYGVEVKGVPVENLNYEGHENLMKRAMEGLSKYEVK